MADYKLVKILWTGASLWNKWREDNPHHKIDLSNADFSGIHCYVIDLSYADLSNAILSRADFRMGNFSSANLSKADLREVKFSGANLTGATLTGATLTAADFSGTNLSEANLTGTSLTLVGFAGAILSETRFSSKQQLNDLKQPLTKEQLAGAIFEDEEQTRAEPRAIKPFCTLHFKGEDADLTPTNLGILLVAVEVTYNRLLYLHTTEGQSYNDITRTLSGPCYPIAQHQVRLTKLQTGSLLAELGTFATPEFASILSTFADNYLELLGTIWAGARAYRNIKEGKKFDREANKIETDEQIARETHELQKNKSRDNSMQLLITSSQQQDITPDAVRQHLELADYLKTIKFKDPVAETHKKELIEAISRNPMQAFAMAQRQGFTDLKVTKIEPGED